MLGPKEKDHNDNSTRDFEKFVRKMYEGEEDQEKEESEEDKEE